MSYSPIEKETLKIINEKHNKNYKLKQIMEWTTGEIKEHEGEIIYKENNIQMAIKLT